MLQTLKVFYINKEYLFEITADDRFNSFPKTISVAAEEAQESSKGSLREAAKKSVFF